ncbi:alpha/beta hydrolase [Candidatus Entotheonella palauensis]|uniref:alpha/beta hydrolase n=1 Tax=Candidatus Entotheonella palauensis TaxID=93172 RepID=UPI0015C42A66|nr:alpha/beta hydrolase-fold protein [Candidatus Entotheonella palauensis]
MAQAYLSIARIVLGIIVALALIGCEEGGEMNSPDSTPVSPIAQYRLTTDRLFSQYVEEDYDLLLYLPPGHDQTHDSFPVVYALDMAFQSQQQAIDATLATLAQDVIVVGLGNPNDRDRDYTPDRGSTTPEGHGGAANFYNFLVFELLPYIDANYHTDVDNRTLIGHSYGGLFTLFALFSEGLDQRHFNAFIASSPTIGFAAELLADMEAAMFERSRDLPVTLHLSTGQEGPLTNECQAMAALLVSRGYNHFLLMMSEFPASHMGNIKPSYRQGLQLVYGIKPAPRAPFPRS